MGKKESSYVEKAAPKGTSGHSKLAQNKAGDPIQVFTKKNADAPEGTSGQSQLKTLTAGEAKQVVSKKNNQ